MRAPTHVRPFLVSHPSYPPLRIEAKAPRSAARIAFNRYGERWPVRVLDRELGQLSEWWTMSWETVPFLPDPRKLDPKPYTRCYSCGRPIRPGVRPRTVCGGCS